MSIWPPVVYAGPSIEVDEVRRRLPGCQVMPPVRRGDLYRDRLLGFDVFVVLDGVFAQELAVSPRETIDVARDGALVVGASSMGAMRAAECWPAGVQGVGSVYRLFRRGSLTSDAEVAVAFSPEPPYLATSVPLVNVRHALRRAVREGWLESRVAARLLHGAVRIFFADRTWPLVLKAAGVADPDGRLRRALSLHNLKRLDAIRALEAARRMVALRPRAVRQGMGIRRRSFPGARDREASHRLHRGGAPVARQNLWPWLVATGRYRRYDAVGLADVEAGAPATSAALATRLTRHDGALARAVYAGIAAAGDWDALAFTWIAATNAVRLDGRRTGVGAGLRLLARRELAEAHGFSTWTRLRQELRTSAIWPWIAKAAEHRAVARQLRQELFLPAGRQNDQPAQAADRERT